MRITLTIDEYSLIQSALDKYSTYFKNDDIGIRSKELISNLENQFNKSFTTKSLKRTATKKAIETKQQNAKDKITNAVNLLNLENKKINVNSVAKISGCSYNTVKKYKHLIYEI